MFKICVSGRHRSAVGKRVLGMPHPTHIRHQSAGPIQLATLLQLQLPAKESGKKVAAGLSMGGVLATYVGALMEVLTFRLWVSLATVLMINWRIKKWTIPLSFSLALAHFAFQINRFFL